MTPAHSHAYDTLAGETMRSANACEDRSKRTKEGEGYVDEVYIRFINGTSIRFRAREFDISLGRASQEDKPRRFTYKDLNGRETPIYLRLDQVAAIIVTPAGTGQRQ